MAQMYGKQSNYLRNSELKNFLHGTIRRFIGVGILLLLLLVISQVARQLTNYTLLVVLVLIILLLKPFNRFLTRSYRKSEKTADKFYKGRKAENVMTDELKTLPDDYSVFQDVMVPDGFGNIDFVVVCPAGIFALERASEFCRGEVEIWTDSELIVKHMSGDYALRKPHTKELFDKVKTLEPRYSNVKYFYHPRTCSLAKKADKLANEEFRKHRI